VIGEARADVVDPYYETLLPSYQEHTLAF